MIYTNPSSTGRNSEIGVFLPLVNRMDLKYTFTKTWCLSLEMNLSQKTDSHYVDVPFKLIFSWLKFRKL